MEHVELKIFRILETLFITQKRKSFRKSNVEVKESSSKLEASSRQKMKNLH